MHCHTPHLPTERPRAEKLHPQLNSPSALQTQKPEFSQRPGRQDFTLKGMPVRLPPRRTRQTQGIALVVVLLSAMVLMVSLLAISSTMVISSQRTTADQGVTLQAQYAAEAGLARAQTNLVEVQTVLSQMNVANSSRTQIENHARNYCNGGIWTPAPNYSNWTPDQRANGVPLCPVSTGNASNRFSLFTTYTPSNAYPSGTSAALFWLSAFSNTSPSVKIASDAASSSETWYTVSYGPTGVAGLLTATGVRLMAPNFYRFEFTISPTTSRGELRANNRVIASRRVQQDVSGTYSFDVQLPSFARNFVFRDITTNTGGNQLYFAGGETFGGPVHNNGTPGFAKVSGTTPVFTDDFSSCAPNGTFSSYSTTTSGRAADLANTFQGSDPVYGLNPCIDLPTNSNNQKRAAFGGDPEDTGALTEDNLQAAWGVRYQTTLGGRTSTTPMPNGVYYSKGNGTTAPNQASAWNNDTSTNIGGGAYIRGDVDQLKLCANSDRQVIGVRQGTTITTFEENANGTWSVKVRTNVRTSDNSSCTGGNNGTTMKTLSGTFNGMVYVDGDIDDMRGDGTANADVASKSKLTVASTGKVLLKDDITYVDMPAANRPESEIDTALAAIKNRDSMLGIYSSGEKCNPVGSSTAGCGSILADGDNNKDLNIHASLMATKEISTTGNRRGEGFGAVRNNQSLGTVTQNGTNRKVQIRLFGGVIEKQSQTVGDLGSNGYARNYKYDERFKRGYAPPFFPEQADGGESAVIARWTSGVSIPFSAQQGVWQAVGN